MLLRREPSVLTCQCHAANFDRLIGRSVKIEADAIREASARIEDALDELRAALKRNADYWEGR